MSKIQVLPDNLINKIAAGEVVDRPFSIVKELVENALDAQSTEVTLLIKEGGKSSIEVIDDGIGMAEDDLLLAFERHATSKISKYEDFDTILTMGFRGEALPSIASVAMVEAVSKPRNAANGTMLRISGGKIEEVRPTPLVKSTHLKIKSLFYNVPARKKFLKDEQTEYRYIYSYFKKVALSRPDIAFRFFNNDKPVFDLKRESLTERIGNLFPEIKTENLVEVNNANGALSLTGYIGKKELSRKNKEGQLLFVNGRIVENRMISYAIFQAYKNLIEPGYYPFFALFLTLPPGSVDVNVHPAKLEIKFRDENSVRWLIKSAVEEVLAGQPFLVNWQDDSPELMREPRTTPDPAEYYKRFTPPSAAEPEVVQNSLFTVEHSNTIPLTATSFIEIKEPPSPLYNPPPESKFPRLQTKGVEILKFGQDQIVSESVWQLHNKYIVVSIDSGMAIIDQHVAQERIFYEKALMALSDKALESQSLLFPVRVDLAFEDYMLIQDLLPHYQQIGYQINDFGSNTIVVEGLPAGTFSEQVAKDILDMLDDFKKFRDNKMGVLEAVAASYSCKRAIKAGQALSRGEMISLINELFLCKFPHVCPHGRPIIINISLNEIDKKFGRI